jgi:hypothetical protein
MIKKYLRVNKLYRMTENENDWMGVIMVKLNNSK